MIFDDRIEIVSPGPFPEGVTPEEPKHVPVNPTLSQLMYDIGFVEKYGTGIYLIKEECKKHGMSEPKYETGPRETAVSFKSPGKAVLLSEIEKDTSELNERMKKGLKYALNEGSISNREYRKINEVSNYTANIELSKLTDLGILEQIGKGRSVRYKPKI